MAAFGHTLRLTYRHDQFYLEIRTNCDQLINHNHYHGQNESKNGQRLTATAVKPSRRLPHEQPASVALEMKRQPSASQLLNVDSSYSKTHFAPDTQGAEVATSSTRTTRNGSASRVGHAITHHFTTFPIVRLIIVAVEADVARFVGA